MKWIYRKYKHSNQHTNNTFFSKEGENNFSNQNTAEKAAFFQASSNKRKVLQTKLSLGQPNDSFEKEADEMAAKVMTSSTPSQEQPLSKSVSSIAQKSLNNKLSVLNPETEQTINNAKGGANTLPSETKEFMEDRFGTDFNDVRIHTGGEAAQLNNQLGARAFTVGNDIFFNRGEFKPNTQEGKHLIAHELTHVMQQSGGNQSAQRVQRLIMHTYPSGNHLYYDARLTQQFRKQKVKIGFDTFPTMIIHEVQLHKGDINGRTLYLSNPGNPKIAEVYSTGTGEEYIASMKVDKEEENIEVNESKTPKTEKQKKDAIDKTPPSSPTMSNMETASKGVSLNNILSGIYSIKTTDLNIKDNKLLSKGVDLNDELVGLYKKFGDLSYDYFDKFYSVQEERKLHLKKMKAGEKPSQCQKK